MDVGTDKVLLPSVLRNSGDCVVAASGGAVVVVQSGTRLGVVVAGASSGKDTSAVTRAPRGGRRGDEVVTAACLG
jgi:hypothetical protein